MKKWAAVSVLTAVMTLGLTGNAWASWSAFGAAGTVEGGLLKNEWINMEKGPGVAQWVDENGNVTEQPGVIPGGAGRGTVSGEVLQSLPSGPGDSVGGPDSQEPDAGQQDSADEPAGRVIDPAKPMVALTFDDGPQPSVGNRIMDCLAQYGGKATFYVVGNRCAGFAEEMQRMAAEGHEIGNHTYEHKYLNKLGAADIQYQIRKGREAIQAASGVVPATVRLPGGNKNATVLANVTEPIVLWSIDTLDWKTRDAGKTVEAVLNYVKDGDIVLMHELYSQTGDAALQIIPALAERGYQLVTVSEMAQYRGGLEAGKIYYSFPPQ